MMSVDEWRKHLVTLDDGTFIGMMRNYLGSVRTPFHKHTLIDSLAEFLRKDDVRERILESIDAEDAEFLTAVAMYGDPRPTDLIRVFSGRYPDLECRRRIINLEERLLVVRTTKEHRLAFSPMFEEPIREHVVDPGILFPSEPVATYPPEGPWLSRNLFLSLISFLMEWENAGFRKVDGGIRQKFADELDARFPILRNPARRALALRSVENLGFEGRPAANHPSLEWFCTLTETQIDEVLLASALGGDLGTMWAFVTSLRDSLPGDRQYEVAIFRQILALVAGRVQSVQTPALDELETLGMVVANGEYRAINPHLVFSAPSGEGSVRVAGNFDLTWSGSIPFSDVLLMVCSSRLNLYDRIPRLVLEKSHFMSAQEAGFSGDDLIATLDRWAALPQNIRFSLMDWLSAYRSVQLGRPLVIRGSDGKAGVVESLFGEFALEHLAPGVLVLDETRVDEWGPIATDMGLTVPVNSDSEEDKPHGRSSIPTAPAPKRLDLTPNTKKRTPAPSQRGLESKLAGLDLAASQRDDILERIERKVVVHPSQISAALAGRENLEARGLDYGGKVRLIERAIASRADLLEIVAFGEDGDQHSTIVNPVSLSKNSDGHNLNALSYPEERQLSLPVRKMGRIKRLRGSFFEA
jgi:hypothetical protein